MLKKCYHCHARIEGKKNNSKKNRAELLDIQRTAGYKTKLTPIGHSFISIGASVERCASSPACPVNP
jgi:hypothetical protein